MNQSNPVAAFDFCLDFYWWIVIFFFMILVCILFSSFFFLIHFFFFFLLSFAFYMLLFGWIEIHCLVKWDAIIDRVEMLLLIELRCHCWLSRDVTVWSSWDATVWSSRDTHSLVEFRCRCSFTVGRCDLLLGAQGVPCNLHRAWHYACSAWLSCTSFTALYLSATRFISVCEVLGATMLLL